MTAISLARQEGIPAGLLRPITLFPFPEKELAKLAKKVKGFLVAELSSGQLIEDVKLAVGSDKNVQLVGRYGGVPLPVEDVLEAIRAMTQNL
jgi:2-oxoglutarate ferredoxin oxidoreductase subunit alpha